MNFFVTVFITAEACLPRNFEMTVTSMLTQL